MAIRKSLAVSKVLERAVERLHAKPQPGAAEMVSGARQIAKLLDGLEAIAHQRNPTETREAHALRVAKAAEQLLAKVKDAEARDNTTRTLAANAVQARLNDVTKLAEGPRSREIRDVFRAMSKAEQSALIDRAMQAQDHETLGAILTAPAFLSGMDATQQAGYRTHYETAIAPKLVAEFDEILAADESAATVRRVAREVATEARQPDFIAKIEKDRAEAERAQQSFDSAAGEVHSAA